jgi:uncharacterized protein involved in response to NO
VSTPVVTQSSDTRSKSRWPVLRLGFRPFYLMGLAAAFVLPLGWLALLSGASFSTSLPPLLWHGHEMLFGFVVAIIVGFLLTAGRLWTGLATPTGPVLAALALLWLAGRVAAVAAPYRIFFLIDISFLPVVASVFIDRVVRSRNWRNLPMAILLVLLALANMLFHLGHLGLIGMSASDVLHATVALVVVMESIVAGRVIPAFIGNAVPGSHPRTLSWIEHLFLPTSAIAFTCWIVAPRASVTPIALALLALLHGIRLVAWQPWVARRNPILWILPAGYIWIPIGIAMLAAAALGWVPQTAGLHALTAGSMGCLIAAMVTRTSRGHTGRPLAAGRLERTAYVAVLAAAAVRVAVALQPSALSLYGLLLSGVLWSAAFGLILVTLLPWLLRPRLDGKPG